MAREPHTEVITVATALADFDPTFLAAIDKLLTSWVSKNAKGPASLAWMSSFCNKGYDSELRRLIARLPKAKLDAFVSKLDKYNSSVDQFSVNEKIVHVCKIASGETEPEPKPKVAPKSKTSKKPSQNAAPKLSLQEIIRLDSDDHRCSELSRLTDAEIKRQVQDIGMDVPTGLKKPQRIQFILDELAAGWPKPRSILDSSRY